MALRAATVPLGRLIAAVRLSDARTPLPSRSPLGVGTVARRPAVQAGALSPLPLASPEAGAVRPAVPSFPFRSVRRLVGQEASADGTGLAVRAFEDAGRLFAVTPLPA